MIRRIIPLDEEATILSRIVALTLGLIAGAATFTVLWLHWSDLEAPNSVLDRAALSMGLDTASLFAALAAPLTRFSWVISISTIIFACVTLGLLLIGGGVETAIVRKKLRALRRDTALEGQWNAADWRAVFAGSAVADRAEAIVAAIIPPAAGSMAGAGRRIAADTALLAGLHKLWLDRLAMTETISPLPLLLIGLTASLTLLRHSGSGEWEITLAAGTAGAFVIQLSYYLVRSALSFSIALSVRDATAAIRPLTAIQSLAAIQPAQAPPPTAGETPQTRTGADIPSDIEQLNAYAIGKALASVLVEPLHKLTEAADRFSLSAVSRERIIDSALAEVRGKIERLLAASPSGED